MGVISILGFLLIITSCKKEDSDTTPVDNSPALTFLTGPEYVSTNISLEINTTFKVGVLGSKNPNTNIDIATFRVVRILNGLTENVYENLNVGDSYLSWESTEQTNASVGEETWKFTITDYTGMTKEISLVITTLEQGALAPTIIFTEGNDFVSHDTALSNGADFLVGINAFANTNTNQNLQSFIIKRTINNNTITVYEEANINSANYSWQDTLTASSGNGEETWSFAVVDIAGSETEQSFVVSTTQSPYTPDFSTTYLVVEYGGAELLDFYLTCVTDDWEMVKINATYPGGGGTDVFAGNGQIILQGSPYTFPQYFTNLGGTWTFFIIGYIKSGPHLGETFTVYTSVTVTG